MSQDGPLVYLVEGPSATAAPRISLAEAGLREVQDLQEWVIAHREVIGDNVLIVTSEFSQWASGAGATARERLDVLGLDQSGRLVVVELKRASDPRVHVQAITYAALVAGFDEARLADVHADFLTKRGVPTDSERALELLRDHVEVELNTEVLSVPRIVLIAEEFPPQVLTTVVWLTRRQIAIELREVHAHRLTTGVVVTFDQVYPVPGIDGLLLEPARKETADAVRKADEQAKAANATRLIVDRGLLAAGSRLTLQPTSEVDQGVRAQIAEWVVGDPARGEAIWVEDPVRPIRWSYDGVAYRPTTLVRRIIKEAAGVDRSVRGTSWWVTEQGLTLPDIAFGKGGRDWTDVHELISVVTPGHWTSYGDIAQVVGLPALGIGQHVAACAECPDGAHRVLTQTGVPSDGFHWTDPDDERDLHQVLVAEGLNFDSDGRADPAQHLPSSELTRLRKTAAHPDTSGYLSN